MLTDTLKILHIRPLMLGIYSTLYTTPLHALFQSLLFYLMQRGPGGLGVSFGGSLTVDATQFSRPAFMGILVLK